MRKWAESAQESLQPKVASAELLQPTIASAKSLNMPKDNIERAIKKGQGNDPDSNYEEVRYEGYGPEGIAIIVEALTNNKNRTAAEIRSSFSKHGGNLGETGSVSFGFDRFGNITLDKSLVKVRYKDCKLLLSEMKFSTLPT